MGWLQCGCFDGVRAWTGHHQQCALKDATPLPAHSGSEGPPSQSPPEARLALGATSGEAVPEANLAGAAPQSSGLQDAAAPASAENAEAQHMNAAVRGPVPAQAADIIWEECRENSPEDAEISKVYHSESVQAVSPGQSAVPKGDSTGPAADSAPDLLQQPPKMGPMGIKVQPLRPDLQKMAEGPSGQLEKAAAAGEAAAMPSVEPPTTVTASKSKLLGLSQPAQTSSSAGALPGQQPAPTGRVFRTSARLEKAYSLDDDSSLRQAMPAPQVGAPIPPPAAAPPLAEPQPPKAKATMLPKAKVERISRREPVPAEDDTSEAPQKVVLPPQVAQQWNAVRRKWDVMHQQWSKPQKAKDYEAWHRQRLEEAASEGTEDEDTTGFFPAFSSEGLFKGPLSALERPSDRQSSASSGVLPIELHLSKIPGRSQSAPFGMSACCTVPPLEHADSIKSKGVSNQTWVSIGTRMDAVWRVQQKTWIRKELQHSSARVFPLKAGDEITVTALVKEELRTISPAVGWVSLVSDKGEPLVALSRQGDEPIQAYPTADLSEAFYAAVTNGDVAAAGNVANDLVAAGEATSGHCCAALLALAYGHTAWREICELLDMAVYGGAIGASSDLQKAICRAEGRHVMQLLNSHGEGLAKSLPERHVYMTEVLYALASQRCKASAREGTHHADRAAWEAILRGTIDARSPQQKQAMVERIEALCAPESVSFHVQAPAGSSLNKACGIYDHVGDENGYPAYRLGGKTSSTQKPLLIFWHHTGMWWIGAEGTHKPLAVANGGWIPPLTGWTKTTEGDSSISLSMVRAGTFIEDAQQACERGDASGLATVAAAMSAAPSWLVDMAEERLKNETDPSKAAAWQDALTSWQVPPERLTLLLDSHRYRDFPKLSPQAAWRLLSLCRIQAKEQLAGMAVDLLSIDPLSPTARSMVMFDRQGIACLTTDGLRLVLQSLQVPAIQLEGVLADATAAHAGGRGVLDVVTCLRVLATLIRSEKQLEEEVLANAYRLLKPSGGELSAKDLKVAMLHFELVLRKHGLGDFCIRLTDEEVRGMLQEADLNRDGVVDLEEFKKVMRAVSAA